LESLDDGDVMLMLVLVRRYLTDVRLRLGIFGPLTDENRVTGDTASWCPYR
jgi:hypothetical protein